jgi:catechol 2,3-dioxygenase-like lactoylglutathione lyase family enzyme
MQVHELNHVALHVRDIAVSRRFYEGILGLPTLPRPAFPFDGAWYALGPHQELHLIVDDTLPVGERHHGHFALRVENSAAVRRELEARGATELRGPAPRPDGALQIFLPDPDGHLIELLDTSTLR